jgi:2,3-bisphosphoglycerate-independent phosphoglycerate mutase
MNKQTTILIVLDGYGYSKEVSYNAIAAANKPCMDRLLKENPNALISGSGKDVGLPDKQMGNSEVGHMNLGAGRVIYQDFTRISASIDTKEFFGNNKLVDAFSKAKQQNSAVHILGLLSPGGIHSHNTHIHALVDMAKAEGVNKLFIHVFTDGRDTPPKSALQYISSLEDHLQRLQLGTIATVSGRFFAMDRDNRWDRVQQVYDMLTTSSNKAHRHATAKEAIEAAYQRGETDEFIQPSCIASQTIMAKDDIAIFMNFRADRAIQLTEAFIKPDFNGFNRASKPQLAEFMTLTKYKDNLNSTVIFPPISINNCLGEVLQNCNKTQLRAAETEKYAHVTYFFNGGREQPFNNEDRILVPSPKVDTYDMQPEMSAAELTANLVKAIKSGNYDCIVCNYANCDMVGHTGNFNAAVKAVETIDKCMAAIELAALEVNAQILITADHGNAEKMLDVITKQPHTAHTCNPVPLIYIGNRKLKLKNGILADIAPTMLDLLNIEQPVEMTGNSLIC